MPSNSETFKSNPIMLDVSRFKKKHKPVTWSGTFNTGYAVPVFAYSDILPGDTFSIDTSFVLRGTTPVAPVMDDAFIDYLWYFVPSKLVLSRQMMSPSVNDSNRSFAALMGAQDSLLNMPLPEDVRLPAIDFGAQASNGDTNAAIGSLGDLLGYPISASTFADGVKRLANPIKSLSYFAIWNSYLRDSNTMPPVTFSIGNYSGGAGDGVFFSGGATGMNELGFIGEVNALQPASALHSYFGSALPWPQRNAETISVDLADSAPVFTSADEQVTKSLIPLKMKTVGQTSENLNGYVLSNDGTIGSDGEQVDLANEAFPANLYADLREASSITINELRLRFQEQRWYEQLARSGNSSLGEITYGMFGVRPSDYMDGRPEYLGGKRVPITQIQVAQTAPNATSGTSDTNGLGITGAFSLTGDRSFSFTKSFDTWGTIMCIAIVRVGDTFSQGLSKEDTRFERFDYYWPQFANLGEQPIYNQELYFSGTDKDKEVFGYQEYAAEYRTFNSKNTGLTRPGQSLNYWNYGNNFSEAPTLSYFLNASRMINNINQTLQTDAQAAGYQWLAQFGFSITTVRPMPAHSIPGLIDHH